MGVDAATAWAIWPGSGSSANGGGFKAGASGTDYSLQNTAQYALTGVTSAGAGNVILSASAAADMVGNIAHVVSGTNFNTGDFQVSSVVVGVSLTLSTNHAGQSISTGVGASGVVNIGGAKGSFVDVTGSYEAGNRIFGKGSETITASLNFATGTNSVYTLIAGYTSVRGDAGKYGITLNGSTLTAISGAGAGLHVENFDIDCASQTASTGVNLTGARSAVRNIKVSNFKTQGIQGSGLLGIDYCEVTGGVSGATSCILANSGGWVLNNYVHDNACPGISNTAAALIMGNNCSNNSGSASDGIISTVSLGVMVHGNTCHGNGRHGIFNNIGGVFNVVLWVRGNLLTNNGVSSGTGYGISFSNAPYPKSFHWDGNAYNGNQTGTRQNMDSTSGIDGVGNYTNAYDVALSGSPYISVGGLNWGLDLTTTAGRAAWQSFGPSATPGGVITRYPSFGAYIPPALYAAAGDIRNGINRGDGVTGTLTLPTAGQVITGVSFGAGGTEFSGTYVCNLPADTDVRSGVNFGPASIGSIVIPAQANVLNGVVYDNGTTGSYVVVADDDVRFGITFGASAGETGTIVLPATTNVRNAIQYGADGTEFTGNVVLPSAGDVKTGIQYGASGTQYTGTLAPGSGGGTSSGKIIGG